MRRIPVLQIGVGGVGRELLDQVLRFNERWGGRLGFRFALIGLADRSGAIVDDERIPPAMLLEALAIKRAGGSLADFPEGGPLNDWRNLLTPAPCLLVDTTAQDDTADGMAAAVAQGHRVVLANKKPLCGSIDSFRAITEAGRARYEATVGAGLPVIGTLRYLLETGDEVEAIEGCFSGTLGYLATALQDGAPFGAAVREAKSRGWTEPDPRDDLGGTDVARKALILARSAGVDAELSDVAVESLYPATMADLPVDEFMARIDELDEPLGARFEAAAGRGATLRYVASAGRERDRLRVGLQEVPSDSLPGGLRGLDNLVLLRTRRYREAPLSVRGPGAGVEVTAAAVLGDMIAFAREWR